MPHHARTYGLGIYITDRQNAWKYPTGPVLDNFGVPVESQNFGLEEFNYNDTLLDLKLAYVPCFGTSKSYSRPDIKELRLLYRVENNGVYNYVHYATLFGVQSLLNEDIHQVREVLTPNFESIYLRQECADFFGDNYPIYEKKIREMLNSNLIAANDDNNSFLVNVKYDKLEYLDKPNAVKMNSHFASNWYLKVIYPGITLE